MYATWMLFAASLQMLVRDRPALVGTVAFPLLFVGVFSLFDLDLLAGGAFAETGGVDYFSFVFPGLLAMGLMNFTMVGVAASVARFREMQILKRIQATALPPSRFLLAQVGARLVLAVVQLAVMVAVGLALGAQIRGSWIALLGLATVGNLVFLILGFAIAGRAPSVDAANNIAGLATLPLMFLSGMFFPVDSMPTGVRAVAAVLPITPLIDALRAVSLEGVAVGALGGEVAVLAAWVPVSLLLARLSFRFTQR